MKTEGFKKNIPDKIDRGKIILNFIRIKNIDKVQKGIVSSSSRGKRLLNKMKEIIAKVSKIQCH